MRLTRSIKPSEVKKNWELIDARGMVVGRLAALIASRLRGKHKASFTRHVDCGDNIIVVNASKLCLTGNKAKNKEYIYHTGYPGGIKRITTKEIFSGTRSAPSQILRKAVLRMLPKESPLSRKQFKNLYVYDGEDHPHVSLKPQPLNAAQFNKKNKR